MQKHNLFYKTPPTRIGGWCWVFNLIQCTGVMILESLNNFNQKRNGEVLPMGSDVGFAFSFWGNFISINRYNALIKIGKGYIFFHLLIVLVAVIFINFNFERTICKIFFVNMRVGCYACSGSITRF